MKTHSILNKDVVDAQLHTHTHYYALVQQNGPGIPKKPHRVPTAHGEHYIIVVHHGYPCGTFGQSYSICACLPLTSMRLFCSMV